MSLTLVKRRRSKHEFVPCSNGCHDPRLKKAQIGFRAASYDAVILDVEVPLCSGCAAEWARIWDGALDGDRELVPA